MRLRYERTTPVRNLDKSETHMDSSSSNNNNKEKNTTTSPLGDASPPLLHEASMPPLQKREEEKERRRKRRRRRRRRRRKKAFVSHEALGSSQERATHDEGLKWGEPNGAKKDEPCEEREKGKEKYTERTDGGGGSLFGVSLVVQAESKSTNEFGGLHRVNRSRHKYVFVVSEGNTEERDAHATRLPLPSSTFLLVPLPSPEEVDGKGPFLGCFFASASPCGTPVVRPPLCMPLGP